MGRAICPKPDATEAEFRGAVAVVFVGKGRTVTRARVEPTGTPRKGARTASERGGQP